MAKFERVPLSYEMYAVYYDRCGRRVYLGPTPPPERMDCECRRAYRNWVNKERR